MRKAKLPQIGDPHSALQLSDGKNQASFLDISSLVDMKHLDTLYIRDTPNWKRLEVYWAGRAPNDPRDLMMI
ncbi:hypothetical protein ACFX11_025436 [Malus domestica]